MGINVTYDPKREVSLMTKMGIL